MAVTDIKVPIFIAVEVCSAIGLSFVNFFPRSVFRRPFRYDIALIRANYSITETLGYDTTTTLLLAALVFYYTRLSLGYS